MKKFLSLVLAILMIASSVVSVAAFEDVAENNKYVNAVNGLKEYGIVAGKSATEFAPDELVTRWQMALFMARATSGETNDAAWKDGAALFTDCSQYLGAIQYCYTKGIIKGVSSTEFAPNANITLRDGVIMAVRALNYEKEDEGVEASAKKYNVTGASYWLPYYQKADEIGMLENLKDLSVTKELTRAQTAQLIYNMLNSVVYNYDVNGHKYTLEDVVFGGKQIVNVDNVTGAWISETPLQSIGPDTIGDDEDLVVLTVNDRFSHVTVEVPFDDLAAAGIDVKNIENYFGAYIELINCRVDHTGRDEDQDVNYIYKEYEYLAGVNKDNRLNTTDAEVSYHKNEDRIRIGSKTHYLEESEKVRNYLALYTVENADDGYELIYDRDPAEINAEIKDKLYDVTFIDTDIDGYYEVGLVNYYNIAEYSARRTNGKETCGVMEDLGIKDAKYSKSLSTGDIFVYTYNPFLNIVDVKGVVEANEGDITGYSEKTDDEGVVTARIEIDDKEYIVEGNGYVVRCFGDAKDVDDFISEDTVMDSVDLEDITKQDLRSAASNNVGETIDYYVFNDILLAFGDLAEIAADEYLVIEDFSDFELYDHVVLDAVIDGKEKSIKVKKIYEKVGNTKKVWANFADLSYGKIFNKLDDIFGVYSYSVDSNGYYVLTKYTPTLDLGDYVSTVGKGTDNVVSFDDWEVDLDDVVTGNRKDIIRVSSDTTIYLVNEDDQTVEIIKPKRYFSIDVASENDVTFITDRIGYGNEDDYHYNAGNVGVRYGIASILYILTDGEYVDYSDYKFVYVDSALTSVGVGDADSYELETGDEDTTYYHYSSENDEAYNMSTLKDVNDIYVSKEYRRRLSNGKILPGVYLLNSDNIVVDHELKDDIKVGENTLACGNAELPYYYKTVKASDIDLHGYKTIRVPSIADLTNTNNVKTVTFRFFEIDEDDEMYAVDKSNSKLVDYLNKYYYDAESEEEIPVNVLVVPNTYNGFDENTVFPQNTLYGIVLGAAELPEDDETGDETGDEVGDGTGSETGNDPVTTYSVTFKSNDKSDDTQSPYGVVDNLVGSYVLSTVVPTVDGFTFVGWSTNKDAVEGDSGIVNPGDTINVTDNVTYYAIWRAN